MRAFKDLQDFMEHLRKIDELHVIDAPVDTYLEITEITDRISKQYGKALLFTNVKDSKYPVLINSMGTYERMSMGLGVEKLDDVAGEIAEFLDFSQYQGFKNKMGAASKFLKMTGIFSKSGVFPKKVKNAACQEVVEDADLTTLPVLQCWPQDGGRYITLPLVFTRDPETGQQNMGMYRLQVYDKNTTGMHWHLHKDGRDTYDKHRRLGIKKMPVSVVVGADPATIFSSTAPLPKMVYELILAGFLRQGPVEVVKCVSNDLYVPANAEFVLEGYVDVDEELRLEGPFGDHTGYYSLSDMYPVFHVEKITRKKNPVYATTVVGQPPQEDCYIAKATERIFLPLMKAQLPELVNMNLPLEGVFHSGAIISIKKAYPRHPHKVMYNLWGLGQMMYQKMIIIIDKDVDAFDINAVMYKVFNEINPTRDLVISDGPLDALDHSSTTGLFGYRLGIDCTAKLKQEIEHEPQINEYKADIRLTEGEMKAIKEKYPEVKALRLEKNGIFNNVLVIGIAKSEPHHGRVIMERLWTEPLLKYQRSMVVVDEAVDVANESKVLWKLFNNIDAKRDLITTSVQTEDNQTAFHFGIDATKKVPLDGHTREWPDDIEMTDEIKAMVSKRWNEYGLSNDKE